MGYTLPTYEEAELAMDLGTGDIIHEFVREFEPAGFIDVKWRQMLVAIIDHVTKPPVSVPTDDGEMADVRAFAEKFNQLRAETPRHLTRRKLAERANFMLEELKEFTEACGLAMKIVDRSNGFLSIEFALDPDNADQDLSDQADALIDLVYVAKGTAVMLGLPWVPLWDDVQVANMRKELGATTRSRTNPGQYLQDVGKPPGWVGPKTGEILKNYGGSYIERIRDAFDETQHADDLQYKGE